MVDEFKFDLQWSCFYCIINNHELLLFLGLRCGYAATDSN